MEGYEDLQSVVHLKKNLQKVEEVTDPNGNVIAWVAIEDRTEYFIDENTYNSFK